MVRIAIILVALGIFLLGGYEIMLSFTWPSNASGWQKTEGWLTDLGGEYAFRLPGRKARALRFLIQDQHVAYVFFVNDAMYYKYLELPPNLAPVRAALNKQPAGNDNDLEDMEEDFSSGYDARPAARFNPETRKLEILTEPGTTISTNFATSHMGDKWEEVGKEAWDQYLPRVTIKYNPKNPEESITEPDFLNGAPTLFWSGVTLIIAAILLTGAIFFHAWVTKPGEEPEPYGGTRYPKR
ncbi:MAG: hypothetical protein KC777_22865 [Cyanobacteria bacterium HKST-UBA02]|nr:hypothetical protein [Cyanobacteria bacterium HKST-UBA02]